MTTLHVEKHEQEIITETFLYVTEDMDRSSEIFYQKLFRNLPEAEQLFADSDMDAQGRKFVQFFATFVKSLSYTVDVHPDLKALGKRHQNYSVKPEYFDHFGDALLAMLAEVLDDKYTEEVERTWIKVYTILAEIVRNEL